MRGGARLVADTRSLVRFGADILLFRLLGRVPVPGRDGERRIRLKDGVTLTYRLNRGDIQSIREVWINETYRLPFDVGAVRTVVDLGANIGLTSVWLARAYGAERVLAVEPSRANADLARRNMRENGVSGEVVEAAVGPADGTARFAASGESNLGRVSASGDEEVLVLSMASILERYTGGDGVDVVKLDIEGGEQPLLEGDRTWLRHVRALTAEFHPDRVDYPGLVETIRREGFHYVAAGSVLPGAADAFIRSAD
jgi:FkbM family methyltransferase